MLSMYEIRKDDPQNKQYNVVDCQAEVNSSSKVML